MIVETRFFGQKDVEEKSAVTFPSGLVGMKELKRFVLLDSETEKPFRWLQSLDDPKVCFLSIEPRALRPSYRVAVSKEDLELLGAHDVGRVFVLCLVSLSSEPRSMTVNFQGPLLVNGENGLGKQLILVEGQYNARPDMFQELRGHEADAAAEAPSELLDIKKAK